MKSSMHVVRLGLCLATVALAGLTGLALRTGSGVHAQDNPAQPAFYTERVLPVLQANCYRCHGGVNHRGGLNLDTRESMLKGGHHGPAVVPGDPSKSWMITLIRHEGPADDPMNMPPSPKPKLSDTDIAIVENWIKAGAVMPAATVPSTSPAR